MHQNQKEKTHLKILHRKKNTEFNRFQKQHYSILAFIFLFVWLVNFQIISSPVMKKKFFLEKNRCSYGFVKKILLSNDEHILTPTTTTTTKVHCTLQHENGKITTIIQKIIDFFMFSGKIL